MIDEEVLLTIKLIILKIDNCKGGHIWSSKRGILQWLLKQAQSSANHDGLKILVRSGRYIL